MDPLVAIGWGPRWEARLAALDARAQPGRVIRHDGVAVQVRTPDGDRSVKLRRGLPPITVGDWLALRGEQVVGLLERDTLLRRRAAGGEEQQLLAANVDLVVLVAGLDRPIARGRIRRGVALAADAGAEPLLALTKADLADDVAPVLEQLATDHPGLPVLVTSSAEGAGVDELRDRMTGRTTVLLGESGAGKSRLVNAVVGEEVAVVGRVRRGDAKGRHTTTNRHLHVLPGGGAVVDSPGIREVGLAGDEESVDATFADIDELGEECHFSDCRHDGEPGCAVALAIEAGTLTPERVEAYRELRAEVEAPPPWATRPKRRR